MDTSNIMQILSDKMGSDSSKLDSLFSMMQSSNNASNSDNKSSNSSTTSEESTNFEMPDIETIMKIKKVVDNMKSSSNDPSIALLSSLKPYLRDEKKSKVDEYIKIIGMSKAISAFNDIGGDTK